MLAVAVLSLLAIRAAATQTREAAVPTTAQLLASISAVDIDRDGANDSIELFCTRRVDCDANLYFDLIRFNLSASGSHAFQSPTGWARFQPAGKEAIDSVVDPALFPKPNILRSPFAYAHVFPLAGTLVFLLGQEPGGSTFAGVTVFSVAKTGVTKYFEPDEFILMRFIGPQANDKRWRVVAGTAAAEVFVDDSFPDAQLTTYCPTTVFILGRKLSIDTRRTEQLARRKYGGYAGPLPRGDVMAVTQDKPPRHYLVSWPDKKLIR